MTSTPVLLGQLFWKPDLILCIAPSIMNAPLALVVARLCGAKAWLHIQDFEVDAAFKLGMAPASHFLERLATCMEHWLLTQFDSVSTISNQMQARLIQKGVPRKKTVLFPNWVDTGVIFPLSAPPAELKNALHIPDGKNIVLYSGNMGHKQGLEVVVAAAALLQDPPKIHFVLCGDGAVRADLEGCAKDIPNIQFMPLQPPEKLNQLLNLADIHLLPQRADAADLVMPSKLAGMFASGKVVIATANPGTEVAKIIGDLGVVVPPDDAPALAKAILGLATDPKRMHALGQKGLSWVIANWSKEKVLDEFSKNLLDSLSAEKNH
jgi:colanic acid biosynthesis glycosyl transferase WcaI